MLLYRPFLHYVSPKLTAGKEVDERYYAFAAAGINVSRNIVHIGMEIKKQSALIGPYWFILYTQYFAILALVFYALENPDKAGASEIMADAIAGREMIYELSQRSMPADRVNSALTVRRKPSILNLCPLTRNVCLSIKPRHSLILSRTESQKGKAHVQLPQRNGPPPAQPSTPLLQNRCQSADAPKISLAHTPQICEALPARCNDKPPSTPGTAAQCKADPPSHSNSSPPTPTSFPSTSLPPQAAQHQAARHPQATAR